MSGIRLHGSNRTAYSPLQSRFSQVSLSPGIMEALLNYQSMEEMLPHVCLKSTRPIHSYEVKCPCRMGSNSSVGNLTRLDHCICSLGLFQCFCCVTLGRAMPRAGTFRATLTLFPSREGIHYPEGDRGIGASECLSF